MPKETSLVLSVAQALVGPVVVAVLGWVMVSVVGLLSLADRHDERLERMESDLTECRIVSEENDSQWHNCRERFERVEAILRRYHDHDQGPMPNMQIMVPTQ